MGLKISEAFKDRCFLTVLATGAPATLLADVTCVEIDQLGNRAPLVVAEESDGWYTTSFTPDAAGTWATEWSKTLVPENYVFHYPYKEFMVGGGQEADIYTDTQALIGRLTAARAGYLDELAAANIPADVDTLLTRLSALRAGYLDNLSAGAVALNADMATVLTRLSAARAGYLDNLSAGAVALASVCTEARLGELAAANLPADIDTLLTRVSAARAGYFDNLSAGAVALASVCTEARLAELAAANLPADIDTLISRLTAARAGYLDKLTNHEIIKTFWSDVDDVVDLPAAATDTDLPNIVLPNIAGTLDHVYVGIKVRMIENTSASGANAIQTAQNIRVKKSTGAWDTDDVIGINLIDNQWTVAASTREGGDVHVGDNDVVAEVDAFNATYNLRIDSANVDYDFLRLNDLQVFLILHYH